MQARRVGDEVGGVAVGGTDAAEGGLPASLRNEEPTPASGACGSTWPYLAWMMIRLETTDPDMKYT